MSDSDILKDIRERKDFAESAWQEIRKEAEIDMRFVAGNPWDANDEKHRKDRPTVAPEEMGQYFNQVINGLMANPRGMKFSPTGNGATDDGAEFYQNKARETEYRSNAPIHYITAATNAVQRSYGYVRVNTRFASPRSANQEIWIEGFPDPDLVLIDPEAKALDSSDMNWAFVKAWTKQSEHQRRHKIKVTNFADFQTSHPAWISGDKVLEAEYWTIATKARKLLLITMPAPSAPPMQPGMAPQPVPPPEQRQVFEDELSALPPGFTINRELRTVDYPTVRQYFTNGLEVLGKTEWPGKYIPIVSCYGKVLYVPEAGETKRKILSMTRFGRDPWKAYCYACSQELEVLAMVPKAPFMIARGQMNPAELENVKKSMHEPVAALTYDPFGGQPASGQHLPPPEPVAYQTGQHLQALEMVKEGFRRAIQAAMGSNFLPTQAQKRNEKSGVALDKMEQAATQGTYHFVYSYKGMIRQVAVIYEDLCDKIHDYRGETGVMHADGKSETVRINDPSDPKAISTKGDYLVSVSDGPSDASEREAAAEFTDTIVSNLQMVAAVAGPKAAAAVLAHAIRMRTELGAMGEALADLIEPPEYKQKDGQPPNPEVMGLQQKVQELTQLLQRAAQEKHTKVVEQQGKFAIAQMQEEAETERVAADREVKLAVAELGAKIDKFALFMQESQLVGARAHEAAQSARDHVQQAVEGAKDRTHQALMADAQHQNTLEQGDASAANTMAAQAQAADLAPQPEAGA